MEELKKKPEEAPEVEPIDDPEVEEEAKPIDEPEVEEEAEPIDEPEAKPEERKRRKHRSKRFKRIRLLVILGLIAAAIVTVNLPYFHVQNVSVLGNDRVSDAEVKRLSEMDDEQSLIGINSILASHRIKINPYVEKVKLKRKFPNTLDIIVTEREPAAQVATAEKDGKKRKYVAVYEDSTVLEISDEKLDMPYIKDVNVLEAKLKSKVKVEKTASYEKAMNIIKTAKENDMFFMRVTVEGSWVDTCVYGDIYCVGRYKNVIAALENGNLKTVVYRLYQKNTRKGTINVADNAYCSFTPKT